MEFRLWTLDIRVETLDIRVGTLDIETLDTPVLKDSHGKKKVAAVLSMGCVEDMLA